MVSRQAWTTKNEQITNIRFINLIKLLFKSPIWFDYFYTEKSSLFSKERFIINIQYSVLIIQWTPHTMVYDCSWQTDAWIKTNTLSSLVVFVAYGLKIKAWLFDRLNYIPDWTEDWWADKAEKLLIRLYHVSIIVF